MVARTETTASGAFALPGAVAEVGAGAEMLACGGEHRGAGACVAAQVFAGFAQILDEGNVEKIVGWPLNLQQRHARRRAADLDVAVVHRAPGECRKTWMFDHGWGLCNADQTLPLGIKLSVTSPGRRWDGAGRPCPPIVRWDNDHTSPDCPIMVA